MGFSLDPVQVSLFLEYLAALKVWNLRMNLTAIRSDEGIIERHFLDSLAGLGVIGPSAGDSLLDIGSGGGFPGLPLKIGRPGLALTLLEASRKKAAFLHHVIGTLRLSKVSIRNERLENWTESPPDFDWVVLRAVGPTPSVLTCAVNRLSRRGRLICYVGRDSEIPKVPGGVSEGALTYELPYSKISRRLELFSRAE